MKFVCDRCQTRYSIADEKVRQKILRIRCKTCGNVIVVQGETAGAAEDVAAPAPGAPMAVPATVRPAAAPTSLLTKPVVVPVSRTPVASAAARPSSLPSVARSASSSTPRPPSAPVAKAAPPAPPPPPPASVGPAAAVEWYIAVGGVRSGPFTRIEASRKVLAAEPGSIVHVWKDGMSDWKPAEEVSVIARELKVMRPSPPPPPAPPKVSAHKGAAPVDKHPRAATPEPVFPGKPLDPLVDGTTERMDVDGADTSQFSEITTKKGGEIGAVAVGDLQGGFAEIATKKTKSLGAETDQASATGFTEATTKKSKNLRDLDAEDLFPSAPTEVMAPAAKPSIAQKTAEVPAPIPSANAAVLPTPAPALKSTAAAAGATADAVAPAPKDKDLGGFAAVLRAVEEPEAANVEPQVFPDLSAPLSPSLDAPPAEAKKTRPGLKYLIAAGIIVALVLLIVLVSFRMDSRKVPVEPEMPQTKAAAEPTVVVADPKPDPEPQTVVAVADEKPSPGSHGGGRRTTTKTVKQVTPAPAPAPLPAPSVGGERPVPKLSGAKSGADSRPNPFDETRTASQSQILAVVRNKTNQSSLKACYERAMKMDNHLTSGRIDVTVSIGMSGIVQHVAVNAPSSFVLIEPCIKQAVRRWVFPPSSEEYATNFPLILQGGT